MGAGDPAVRIGPEERVEADPTPGVTREQAIVTDGMWAGFARTDAHATSGWHHHGEHDSTIYVLTGRLRLESGPGGEVVVDAGPGDFVHVPKGAIHREGNPADTESHIVVVRAGHGPPTINMDGPAPS